MQLCPPNERRGCRAFPLRIEASSPCAVPSILHIGRGSALPFLSLARMGIHRSLLLQFDTGSRSVVPARWLPSTVAGRTVAEYVYQAELSRPFSNVCQLRLVVSSPFASLLSFD